MFNTKIYRQPGGSELTVASGGSINVLAGGVISGITPAGSTVYQSGTLETFQTGASLTINTGVSGTGFRFDIGGSAPSFGAGANVPTHTAVPGSVYLRANGSMSGLFTNIGQDVASSSWRAFQQGSAIS
jgi:hypothetical protein